MSKSSQPTLGEVLDDRQQLRGMADYYKSLKSELDISSVRDLVPLSTQNDPVYLQPANIEKAEWFADLWVQEGRPEFHARGFFYDLLGKGYERPNGEGVTNSNNAWADVQKGAKWAQILGLVPAEKVTDEKNPDPTLTVPDVHETTLTDQREVVGYRFNSPVAYTSPNIPRGFAWDLPELDHETAEEVLDHVADQFAEELVSGVTYDESRLQPYYIEVWAEKGGLLPESLLREYNATIRPAGGGEVSLSMCRDAVQRAEAREQGLVVVHITDFDPKGVDMPKSAARKIELEAAARDVEAHVHHAALTADQVERYDLPGEPGKVPDGDSHGVRAYESHKELFREHGGYPVEVNAFQSQEPQAFRDELEQYLAPYHDEDLRQRLDEGLERAEDDARRRFKQQADAEAVADALAEAKVAVEEYNDEMRALYEEAKSRIETLRERHETVADRVQLSTQIDDLNDALTDGVESVARDVAAAWGPPSGSVGEYPEPLLDTTRPIAKQIAHYQEADIRYGGPQ